uniref:Uncharacterized protein n=1 Tax=Triticum urartu TaxID=4572 RepID=A0A8R7V928_TRIUA
MYSDTMTTNPSRWLSELGGVICFQSSHVPFVSSPPKKKTPATASDCVTIAFSFLTREARSPSTALKP